MKNGNWKYLLAIGFVALVVFSVDWVDYLAWAFFFLVLWLYDHNVRLNQLVKYLEKKEDQSLIQVSIGQHYSGKTYEHPYLIELSGIKGLAKTNDWRKLPKVEQKKLTDFNRKLHELMWHHLTYFHDREAVFIKTKSTTWFKKLKNYHSDADSLDLVELGTYMKGKDEIKVEYHLVRRWMPLESLKEFKGLNLGIYVLTGYLTSGKEFSLTNDEKMDILFNFPELLINPYELLNHNLSRDDQVKIRELILREYDIKEDHDRSDPYQDDFGQYTMWSRFDYQVNGFSFSGMD